MRHVLEQGSPTPRPWTSTVARPVRNQAAQQEVSGGRVSKASSAAPRRSLSSTKPVPGVKKVGDPSFRV